MNNRITFGPCSCRLELPLTAWDGFTGEAGTWPVDVYSVNDEIIGTANNKEDFVRIWNANAANAEVGYLSGFYGPFTFLLKTGCLSGYGLHYLGLGGIIAPDPEGYQGNPPFTAAFTPVFGNP